MAAKEDQTDTAGSGSRGTSLSAFQQKLNAMKKAPKSESVKPFSYKTPAYRGPTAPQYNVRPAPAFYAPPFVLPEGEEVFSDPSYQFRLNEGLKALERSAAARGMLRTGNTLQDLMKYGQDYASQEYANQVARRAQQYGLNYQATRDMYAPGLLTAQWQNEANLAAQNAAYQRAWDAYRFGIDDEFRRQQMLYEGSLRYL